VILKFIEAHKKVVAKYLKEMEEKFPSIGAYPLDDDEKQQRRNSKKRKN